MGKKQILILAIALVSLLLAAEAVWFFYNYQETTRSTPAVSEQQSDTSNNQTNTTPEAEVPAAATLYFPMTNFDDRITVRWYGKLVRATDTVSPCGAPFSGYHDADDLEVTPSEVNADVPVYAVADGVVKQRGSVSGYGGLLVLGVTLDGQDYTVYYGHIDLGSSAWQVGESVKAGQRLANLGSECSIQTDGERKHLHFAIRKGATVDVRGYVPTLSELSAWVNPKVYLEEHGASEVK